MRTTLIDMTSCTNHVHSSWEAMFIEIGNLHKSIIIVNIYGPPHESNELITQFNDEFRKAMHHKITKEKILILSGDFNINLLKINEKILYANFFDMMTSISLLPNITYPTRITQYTNMNEELVRVTTWLSRNKLLINTTNTKMTVFHTQQKHMSYPDVIINNSHVEIVDNFKLLGITVNNHLK